MPPLPRDVVDLYLAPVALQIDRQIAELGAKSPAELSHQVAMASNLPDSSRAFREEALLRAVTHLIDTRGWAASWDPRGIRLQHGEHSLVLGVPTAFHDYIRGSEAG